MRVTVFLLFLIVMLGGACGSDGDTPRPEHEAILQALPVFPGATRVAVDVEPIYEYECNDPCTAIGYRTKVAYQLPEDAASRQVVDLFLEAMSPEWESRVEEIGIVGAATQGGAAFTPVASPTGDFTAVFTRGDDRVVVGTRSASWYGGTDTYGVMITTVAGG